ncbi:hypothetical protein OG292_16595 [Streptomyces sp. NBC_01511]|uniref:hypothetical protein n=1 Tax=unclassified Streptomyces TaxID=2593676 RepID=UPI003866A826
MTTDESDFSSLESVLAQAVDRARVTGRVGLREGAECGTLELTLLGSSRLPFSLNTGEATAWLVATGVDATAGYDEDNNLVIALRGKTGVDQLVQRLLAPFMYAESVRERLGNALAQHRLHVAVEVEDERSLALEVRDSDGLEAAVQLSAVLGADSIGAGLKLHKPGGMRKLADRMRLLLTGALGAGVRVLAEPGCAHAEDELLIHLTVEQGLRLAGRIAAEPARAEQEEDLSPVEEAWIPPIWISSDP